MKHYLNRLCVSIEKDTHGSLVLILDLVDYH